MGMRVRAVWRREWGTTRRTSATSSRPGSRTRPTSPTRGACELRTSRSSGSRSRRAGCARTPPPAGWRCWCRSSREVFARHRADQARHRLLVLGLLGLPGRAGVLVRVGGGRHRRVPADHGVARGDGRRLGAVRGVGEDPDRRGGDRAGVRLRQVLGRGAAPGAGAAARPVPARAAVAGLGDRSRRCRPGWASRPGGGPRRTWPRWPRAAGPRRCPTRTRRCRVRSRPRSCWRGRTWPTRCGRTTAPRSATGAAVVIVASASAGAGAVRAAGLDHRVRAPGRLGLAGRAGPDHGAVGGRRGPGGRGVGAGRGGRAARAVHPPGAPAARGARAGRRRRGQPVGRRAVRQPDVRRRAGPDRAGGAGGHVRPGRRARSGTPPAARRCSRTWCASWPAEAS